MASTELGAEIVSAEPLAGGNVAELIERLRLSDGRTVVFKAATRWRGSGEMLDAAIYTEINLYDQVQAVAPWRAGLLATIRTDDWIGLVIEDLDQPGRHLPPWAISDAQSITFGLAAAHAETLDGPHPAGVIAHRLPDYWTRAVQEGQLTVEWRTWVESIAGHASAALTAATSFVGHRCVTHGDVYDQNIFLVGGQLRLIDWANVGWTAPSRDAVSWALNAEAGSGIDAPSIFALYELHAGEQPAEERRGALAATTGFMALRLGQEVPGTSKHEYLLRRLRPAAKWLASDLDVSRPPDI